MKRLFMSLVGALLSILICSFSGCYFGIFAMMNSKEYSYEYDQSMDRIEKVELRIYDHETKSTDYFMDLEAGDAEMMLTELCDLKWSKPFGDYTRDYFGEIVVYITYSNGEAEVVGAGGTASVATDGDWSHKGYVAKQKEEWYAVLRKYIDPLLLPEFEEIIGS